MIITKLKIYELSMRNRSSIAFLLVLAILIALQIIGVSEDLTTRAIMVIVGLLIGFQQGMQLMLLKTVNITKGIVK